MHDDEAVIMVEFYMVALFLFLFCRRVKLLSRRVEMPIWRSANGV